MKHDNNEIEPNLEESLELGDHHRQFMKTISITLTQ